MEVANASRMRAFSKLCAWHNSINYRAQHTLTITPAPKVRRDNFSLRTTAAAGGSITNANVIILERGELIAPCVVPMLSQKSKLISYLLGRTYTVLISALSLKSCSSLLCFDSSLHPIELAPTTTKSSSVTDKVKSTLAPTSLECVEFSPVLGLDSFWHELAKIDNFSQF